MTQHTDALKILILQQLLEKYWMTTKIAIKFIPLLFIHFFPDLSQPGTNIGINYLLYKILHLPWNQYYDDPAKTVHGGNGGNSVGGNSGG